MAKTYSCRLSDEEARLIEAVIEQTDLTRADLLRGSIAFYLNENPDALPVPL